MKFYTLSYGVQVDIFVVLGDKVYCWDEWNQSWEEDNLYSRKDIETDSDFTNVSYQSIIDAGLYSPPPPPPPGGVMRLWPKKKPVCKHHWQITEVFHQVDQYNGISHTSRVARSCINCLTQEYHHVAGHIEHSRAYSIFGGADRKPKGDQDD